MKIMGITFSRATTKAVKNITKLIIIAHLRDTVDVAILPDTV